MSKIVIKNIDKLVGDTNVDKNPLSNNPLLWKNSIRWIVVGSSGSGKTSMVLQIILNEFKFDKLYICSKTIDHPKYQYIRNKYDSMYEKEITKMLKEERIPINRDIIEEEKQSMEKIVYFYNTADEMPDIETLNPELNNIVIFDDLVLDKKSIPNVEKYFVYGRNKGVKACIYMTQDYYRSPKTIRKNCNILTIFYPLIDRDLTSIYRDTGLNISLQKFRKMIHENLDQQYDFITIDLMSKDKNLKVRDYQFKGISKNYLK